MKQAVLFVQWLDTTFKSNANKGRSIHISSSTTEHKIHGPHALGQVIWREYCFVFASTDRFLCKYGFVYQAAQPISRSMGHMHLTKSYGTGEHSSYQFQTVSSGAVLAPVWLVPDQSCEDGSTFFAIKNDELPGFDQNAAL